MDFYATVKGSEVSLNRRALWSKMKSENWWSREDGCGWTAQKTSFAWQLGPTYFHLKRLSDKNRIE